MLLRTQPEGFPPVYTPGAKALILGSYPSPQSVAAGFYYGNPHNRFWPLIAALTGQQTPDCVAEKTALLAENNLALWDSLAHCDILGASDASIKNARPNDIAALVRQTRIETIFCNGAAAYKYYRRFCEKDTALSATLLPSTSPANAACTFEKLLACWQPLKQYFA